MRRQKNMTVEHVSFNRFNSRKPKVSANTVIENNNTIHKNIDIK